MYFLHKCSLDSCIQEEARDILAEYGFLLFLETRVSLTLSYVLAPDDHRFLYNTLMSFFFNSYDCEVLFANLLSSKWSDNFLLAFSSFFFFFY